MTQDDEQRLEAPIGDVLAAARRGDADRFLATFGKDATLSDWGELHSGRKELSRWFRAQDFGAAELHVTGVTRIAGETLVLLRVVRQGKPPETGTWGFRLAGGKITSLELG